MKKWFEEWLDTYGEWLGLLLFIFFVAVILKGCALVE